MQIIRNPSENMLQYYMRLKAAILNGDIDLDKSEVYALVFGEEVTPDHARKALKGIDKILEMDNSVAQQIDATPVQAESDSVPNKSTVEIHKDGAQTSSKLVLMKEEDSKDTEFLLKAHGYDVEFWELTGAKSNIWNAYSKQDGIMELYSSKITVRPKKNELNFEEIIKHFDNFASTYPCKDVMPKQYKHGAEVLIPCFFDIHFGKLGSIDECGERYDYKIAKERMLSNAQKYIDRLRGREFDKIIFAIGNDYFNSESDGNTVNSTKQDNDTRYSKMFNKGVETLIETIDMFANIAPVEVMLVQGNHAFYTEFYASCVLSAWYRNSKIVTVDSAPTTRKYIKFGKNSIGFTHGNEEKDRIYGLMQHEAASDWGATTTREWLVGHLHTESVTEKNGVVVRRIPSLSGSDAWHVKSGFVTSKKRTMALIYDMECGLTETHYINI